mmetsp:Transcript_33679/g.71575  ORF Transcript_33679/g.71575 Transcript_33679/m.71575 type:complete len:204 (+) Transcript_33679:1-612(+)
MPVPYFHALLRELLPLEHLRRCRLHKDSGRVLCPCESAAAARAVYVLVGGQEFPVLPDELFTRTSLSTGMTAELSALLPDPCVLEVQASGDSLPFILGDTFLRTIVAVFDVGQKTVALAQRAGRPAVRVPKEDVEPRAGPLLPPYMPRQYGSGLANLPWWALVAGVAAGTSLGYLGGAFVGCLSDLYRGHVAVSAQEDDYRRL